MHLVSHISVSIGWMGSADDSVTYISEWLHIGNVKEAYQSTHTGIFIRQMLKHNAQCTHHDFMEEKMSHHALQGWYDFDYANVFNLLSASDERRNPRRAHLVRVQHCQEVPFFRPGSQRVHHSRESHVRGVCRSIELTSLRDASEAVGILNFGQLLRAQI